MVETGSDAGSLLEVLFEVVLKKQHFSLNPTCLSLSRRYIHVYRMRSAAEVAAERYITDE